MTVGTGLRPGCKEALTKARGAAKLREAGSCLLECAGGEKQEQGRRGRGVREGKEGGREGGGKKGRGEEGEGREGRKRGREVWEEEGGRRGKERKGKEGGRGGRGMGGGGGSGGRGGGGGAGEGGEKTPGWELAGPWGPLMQAQAAALLLLRLACRHLLSLSPVLSFQPPHPLPAPRLHPSCLLLSPSLPATRLSHISLSVCLLLSLPECPSASVSRLKALGISGPQVSRCLCLSVCPSQPISPVCAYVCPSFHVVSGNCKHPRVPLDVQL